jgi:medium-chain acyl-[acyl-carrier-protein] hydrolase
MSADQVVERFGRPPGPDATTLVAVPNAGSGASVFASLAALLPGTVDLAAIRLPGRERLLRQLPPGRLLEAADIVTDAITRSCPGRFSILGECTGSIIAFETARTARRRGMRLPQHIFVIGHSAPHTRKHREPVEELPGPQFFDAVKRLGMLPPDIAYGDELWQFMETAIRADFKAANGYVYTPEPPLSSAITVLAGRADTRVPIAELLAWKEHTTSDFAFCQVDGGHLLTATSSAELAQIVMHRLLPNPQGDRDDQ